MVRRTLALLIAVLCCLSGVARAQDAKSNDLAKQLAQLLDQKKLDSIAAADTADPGRFIAALYFPGTQLLVVSAKYAAPELLSDKLTKKDYRDVYIDLSAASVVGTKMLVMDTFADGLVSRPGGDNPADSVERSGATVAFDGGWKKAKQTEADYMKTFGDADSAYAHLLQELISRLKSST
jgi:hypothetical protein